MQGKEREQPTGVWLCCCQELLKVAPKAGRVAIFLPLWRAEKERDSEGMPDPRLGHVACPVPSGVTKHIAQFWLHNFHVFPTPPQGLSQAQWDQRLKDNARDEL